MPPPKIPLEAGERVVLATISTWQGEEMFCGVAGPAVVSGEDGEWYVGHWVYWMPFRTGVRFLKSGTRELTADEKVKWGA